MSDLNRREAIALMAALAAAGALTTPDEIRRAWTGVARARRAGVVAPQFFNPHEYETVRVLVDLIIPRDQRSGSATDAGVPEFLDFMMMDRPNRQIPMRGGLAWLDAECDRRFSNTFLTATDVQRRAVLDDLAWPARARPEMSQGVTFFNSFRDLTASGFWSSKMGVEDLKYLGNQPSAEWTGCPPEALAKLGVKYDG